MFKSVVGFISLSNDTVLDTIVVTVTSGEESMVARAMGDKEQGSTAACDNAQSCAQDVGLLACLCVSGTATPRLSVHKCSTH